MYKRKMNMSSTEINSPCVGYNVDTDMQDKIYFVGYTLCNKNCTVRILLLRKIREKSRDGEESNPEELLGCVFTVRAGCKNHLFIITTN